MPVLAKACCCVQLKNGTIVLGWIGCIYISLSLLSSIFNTIAGYEPFTVMTLVKIPVAFLQYLIYISLIRSAYTQNRNQLIPWLVIYMVQLVILDIIGIYIMVNIPNEWDVILVVLLIGNTISIYLWLMVYSYYQELKEQQNVNRRDIKTDV